MKNSMFDLLGIPVWQGKKFELLSLISSGGIYLEIFSINAEISIGQTGDVRWQSVYLNNSFNLADGHWIKKALEWKYEVPFEKLSGSDLIYDFCEIAHDLNKRVFFLGGEQSVADKAVLKLREKYPKMLVDQYSPPFEKGPDVSTEMNSLILSRVQDFQPDYIIVCLGCPKQEYWLQQNRQFLINHGVTAVMGAGGSLDFVAGKIPRAPKALQNLGFEWLYRLYREPSRWKRQIKLIPFAIKASIEVIMFRLQRNSAKLPK